ncbi:hypothetical protein A2U01_0060645, partial [Trifolium medium]|nr:hypothetical protein [Trifolium medium]
DAADESLLFLFSYDCAAVLLFFYLKTVFTTKAVPEILGALLEL